MQQSSSYALGSSPSELERLRRQSETLSKEANWLFDQLGIRRGWRVLDMGCGPLGVLDILAHRVGRTGAVVGLDASPVMVEQARAFAAASGHRNIEIVQADAGDSKLPRGSFDLVHARLLLINLPPPLITKVVAEMLALARPGGLVVLEDVDAGSWSCDPPLPAWNKLIDTFMSIAGDGKVGRRLPNLLREAGATDIKSEAHAKFCPPGHLWRSIVLHFSDLTRARALQLGLATAEELDAARAEVVGHLEDPRTSVLAPVVVQAWGRSPRADSRS
jgi:SAM-dependent methyltransferase